MNKTLGFFTPTHGNVLLSTQPIEKFGQGAVELHEATHAVINNSTLIGNFITILDGTITVTQNVQHKSLLTYLLSVLLNVCEALDEGMATYIAATFTKEYGDEGDFEKFVRSLPPSYKEYLYDIEQSINYLISGKRIETSDDPGFLF